MIILLASATFSKNLRLRRSITHGPSEHITTSLVGTLIGTLIGTLGKGEARFRRYKNGIERLTALKLRTTSSVSNVVPHFPAPTPSRCAHLVSTLVIKTL